MARIQWSDTHTHRITCENNWTHGSNVNEKMECLKCAKECGRMVKRHVFQFIIRETCTLSRMVVLGLPWLSLHFTLNHLLPNNQHWLFARIFRTVIWTLFDLNYFRILNAHILHFISFSIRIIERLQDAQERLAFQKRTNFSQANRAE